MKYIYKVGKLEEAEARKIMRQLVQAVDHMHRAGIIHRSAPPPLINSTVLQLCMHDMYLGVSVCVCVWGGGGGGGGGGGVGGC